MSDSILSRDHVALQQLLLEVRAVYEAAQQHLISIYVPDLYDLFVVRGLHFLTMAPVQFRRVGSCLIAAKTLSEVYYS